jgi:hypothetical protein
VRLLVPARCPDDQPVGGLLGATGGELGDRPLDLRWALGRRSAAWSLTAGRFGQRRPYLYRPWRLTAAEAEAEADEPLEHQGQAKLRAKPAERIVPVHIPMEFEGIYFMRYAARCDDTRTRTELGVVPRDLQVTLADSVRWLFEQGHISRRQAGQLAIA